MTGTRAGDPVHALGRLVDAVVTVEHDMRVIAAADWVVELGPGGGGRGGTIIARASPSNLFDVADSVTAPTCGAP